MIDSLSDMACCRLVSPDLCLAEDIGLVEELRKKGLLPDLAQGCHEHIYSTSAGRLIKLQYDYIRSAQRSKVPIC